MIPDLFMSSEHGSDLFSEVPLDLVHVLKSNSKPLHQTVVPINNFWIQASLQNEDCMDYYSLQELS